MRFYYRSYTRKSRIKNLVLLIVAGMLVLAFGLIFVTGRLGVFLGQEAFLTRFPDGIKKIPTKGPGMPAFYVDEDTIKQSCKKRIKSYYAERFATLPDRVTLKGNTTVRSFSTPCDFYDTYKGIGKERRFCIQVLAIGCEFTGDVVIQTFKGGGCQEFIYTVRLAVGPFISTKAGISSQQGEVIILKEQSILSRQCVGIDGESVTPTNVNEGVGSESEVAELSQGQQSTFNSSSFEEDLTEGDAQEDFYDNTNRGNSVEVTPTLSTTPLYSITLSVTPSTNVTPPSTGVANKSAVIFVVLLILLGVLEYFFAFFTSIVR